MSRFFYIFLLVVPPSGGTTNEREDILNSKQADVELILKLYELRREPRMREARDWYFTRFQPKNAKEIAGLMLSGLEESRSYRMITSYWDMAASFVLNGGIDEKMFFDANTEHIAVFAVIEPHLGDVRELFQEPAYLTHLEQLVTRIPQIDEILTNRRKLFARWAKLPELRS